MNRSTLGQLLVEIGDPRRLIAPHEPVACEWKVGLGTWTKKMTFAAGGSFPLSVGAAGQSLLRESSGAT